MRRVLASFLLAAMTVIAVYQFTPITKAATEGVNGASTIVSDNSNGGTQAWITPSNAGADDTIETDVDLAESELSDYLNLQNYGFSIPTGATINGIEVDAQQTYAAGSGCRGDAVTTDAILLKGGTPTGDNKATGGNVSNATYGGAADLWGTTWTPSEINATNFGMVVSYTATPEDTCTIEVDFVGITVTYTAVGGGGSDINSYVIISFFYHESLS